MGVNVNGATSIGVSMARKHGDGAMQMALYFHCPGLYAELLFRAYFKDLCLFLSWMLILS